MPKAFDDLNKPGKGLPKSLENLKNALAGGSVGDSVAQTSGAAPVSLDLVAYETKITSGATAGNEVVNVAAAGSHVGQRKLVTFETEGGASDVVRINGSGQTLQSQGAVGETPAAVTNIDLDTPGEFALLEYQGGDTWNLLYTDGVTS